jgi:3-hydroxyisobutyrate dehydrogenase
MRIGVIGVGQMGLGMALRLLERGHGVHVRDVQPDREAMAAAAGAHIAVSPAALAALCDAVIVAVVDAPQLRQVLHGADGVLAATPRPKVLLLCPTIAPGDVEQAAQALQQAGIDAIDAPMSGGPARARDGTMSLMVAAAAPVRARHAALLAEVTARVMPVGDRPGDGARTKLVNNLLAAINLAGAAEAMALALRLGLDGARTLQVIEQSSGQSWIGSDRMHRALQGDLAPRAATALLAKDSDLALAMSAADAGFEPPLARAAAQWFQRALADGHAADDDASLLTVVSRAAAAGPATAASPAPTSPKAESAP